MCIEFILQVLKQKNAHVSFPAGMVRLVGISAPKKNIWPPLLADILAGLVPPLLLLGYLPLFSVNPPHHLLGRFLPFPAPRTPKKNIRSVRQVRFILRQECPKRPVKRSIISARILASTASRLPSMPAFPPLLSIASALSEFKWAITSPKKGQAMQRYHKEQSARSKGARHSCTRVRGPPVALHVSRYTCRSRFPQNPGVFLGVAAVSRHTPPKRPSGCRTCRP